MASLLVASLPGGEVTVNRLVSAVFYIHIVNNYRDAFGLVRLIFFADRVINILTHVGFPDDET